VRSATPSFSWASCSLRVGFRQCTKLLAVTIVTEPNPKLRTHLYPYSNQTGTVTITEPNLTRTFTVGFDSHLYLLFIQSLQPRQIQQLRHLCTTPAPPTFVNASSVRSLDLIQFATNSDADMNFCLLQSIAISLSVCLSVCPLAQFENHTNELRQIVRGALLRGLVRHWRVAISYFMYFRFRG